MAGDWIPIRTDLHDDPAVLAMTRRLEVSRNEVVGALVRFWSWVTAQSATGHAANVTLLDVDRISARKGLGEMLVEVGWLRAHDDGIEVVNFDHWMSKSGKRRILDARRKRRSRSAECPADVRKRTGRQRDQRRVDIQGSGNENQNPCISTLRCKKGAASDSATRKAASSAAPSSHAGSAPNDVPHETPTWVPEELTALWPDVRRRLVRSGLPYERIRTLLAARRRELLDEGVEKNETIKRIIKELAHDDARWLDGTVSPYDADGAPGT